jgi:hypothetical protein
MSARRTAEKNLRSSGARSDEDCMQVAKKPHQRATEQKPSLPLPQLFSPLKAYPCSRCPVAHREDEVPHRVADRGGIVRLTCAQHFPDARLLEVRGDRPGKVQVGSIVQDRAALRHQGLLPYRRIGLLLAHAPLITSRVEESIFDTIPCPARARGREEEGVLPAGSSSLLYPSSSSTASATLS